MTSREINHALYTAKAALNGAEESLIIGRDQAAEIKLNAAKAKIELILEWLEKAKRAEAS